MAASYISAPADFSRANENDITLVQPSEQQSEIIRHSPQKVMDEAKNFAKINENEDYLYVEDKAQLRENK